MKIIGGVEVDAAVAPVDVWGDAAGRGEQAGGVGGQGEVAVAEEADFGQLGATPEDCVDGDIQTVGLRGTGKNMILPES